MAPIKQHRDSAARNRDKTKRRKRPSEHANHLLYRCMGDLCGEECDQELQPVAGQRRDASKRAALHQHQDMEMDAIGSDPEDADYVDERERRRQPPMTKAGRVSKAGAKKTPAKLIKDMPVKLGLQKAERYLCNALEFGVQAGYLTPKDAKGRVLRVASGLLQTTAINSLKRVNTDAMDARAIERRGAGPVASSTNQRSTQRRTPRDITSQEVRDEEAVGDGGVDDAKRSRHHRKSSHSRSKRKSGRRSSHGKRSRSRSHSRRAHRRKKSMGRSRSSNPDGNNRQGGVDGLEEREDMGNNSQETTTSSTSRSSSSNNNNNNNNNNDDDAKSVKSTKSSKSTVNNDSQTSSEDKKQQLHRDNDAGSNDDEEASDDDEDDPIKK